MKRSALIFDLDGTLVDSLPDLQAALNAVLGEIGKPPLPAAEVRAMIGDGTSMLVSRGLAAVGAPPELHEERLRRFLAIYEAAPADRTRPYPGVAETLPALVNSGHRLGICTNKPQRATLAVLEALGLAAYFTAVVGGDALPVRKPRPEHLLAAISGLGAAPDEAVMIGDNEHDVAGARAAGVPVVLMRYGYARVPPDALAPDAALDDFAALPATLARLGG